MYVFHSLAFSLFNILTAEIKNASIHFNFSPLPHSVYQPSYRLESYLIFKAFLFYSDYLHILFLSSNKNSIWTCTCRYKYAAKSQPAPDRDPNHNIVRHMVRKRNSVVNTCFAETGINFTKKPSVEVV